VSFFNELKRRNVLRVGLAYAVTGWLVIQVVETVLPAFGFGSEPVRWTVIGLAVLAIPVVVFAWVFEITPEGLKKERDVDRARSITPQTGRQLDRLIIVALGLALTLFALDRFLLDPVRDRAREQAAAEQARTEAFTGSYGDRSIAVLPFADLSPAGDQEYFSDGIAEEVLNLLAQIPELRVTARTSAFSYKGKSHRITEIGRELNVAHVLEGSVRQAGRKVRITAQLIDARSDSHLWSQTFDRELDDVFAVQDEIAAAVVAELRIKLLGESPKSPVTDAEAYALFLLARHLRRQNTNASTAESQALLERVLAIDADYLPALDDLATVYINQAQSGERPYDEGYELARELTLRARALDPAAGRVYAQLGWIEAYYDGDLQAAARSFSTGLRLAPRDASLIGDVSTFLYVIARLDDALELGAQAVAFDPLHPVSWLNHAIVLNAAGRHDEAADSARRALSLSTGIWTGRYVLGQALLYGGDSRAALETFELEADERHRLAGVALAKFALGDTRGADAALQALVEKFGSESGALIALVYAERGEHDAAFRWLERATARHDPELVEIAASPLRHALEADPRWHALLAKLGRAPEQLAAIEFETKY